MITIRMASSCIIKLVLPACWRRPNACCSILACSVLHLYHFSRTCRNLQCRIRRFLSLFHKMQQIYLDIINNSAQFRQCLSSMYYLAMFLPSQIYNICTNCVGFAVKLFFYTAINPWQSPYNWCRFRQILSGNVPISFVQKP